MNFLLSFIAPIIFLFQILVDMLFLSGSKIVSKFNSYIMTFLLSFIARILGSVTNLSNSRHVVPRYG